MSVSYHQISYNLNTLFFFFLAAPCSMWDLSSPTRDGTRALEVQWKRRVLTTGPPGNFPVFVFVFNIFLKVFTLFQLVKIFKNLTFNL